MTSENLSYSIDGETFAGRLFRPRADGARPCVLVCHEGPGPGEHAWTRARHLADLGYLAFAPDFLGGPFPDRETHVNAIRSLVADPSRLRRRAIAALETVRLLPEADRDRTAAIGFCFGGTVALELARSGADVATVVSFHGGLGSPAPAEPGSIRAAVLVCAGAADPFIGMDDRRAFEEEMTRAAADWQMIVYSGALHGFTNPDINPDVHRGSAYDARADRRSWAAMRQALKEAFGDGRNPRR
jgi:dienelactone hydrolase